MKHFTALLLLPFLLAPAQAQEQGNPAVSDKYFSDDYKRINEYGANIPWHQVPPIDGMPSTDSNGCTFPREMMFVTQSGFLGLGKKRVPIGCMTQEEVNRWNIEQQNRRRGPIVMPGPTYQPSVPAVRTCTGSHGVYTCY